MSFDALGRYVPNHKVWDHIGNILPQVEHSEGIRSAVEFHVASWLPVKFYDKYYENWMVIMPGQAVALDPDGKLMPAEYGLGTSSGTVVYTANDVAAGTIDIATGSAVTAAKTVVLSQLTGVRGASWTAALAGTVGAGYVTGFMGRFGAEAWDDSTKKFPIGIAAYAMIQFAGDSSNPANYTHHNYNMQHQVAVLHDYVIRVPLVPGKVASETVDKTATASNLIIGTANVHTRAYAVANATGRYNASTGLYPVLSTYPVIAIALDNINVAKNTARTAFVLSSDNSNDNVSTILVNEMSGLSGITAAGDYWVDYDAGVIFIYSADGATLPVALSGASGTVTLAYYYNDTNASVVSAFPSVLGPILPGDFVKVGTGSNWVKATGGTDTFGDIMGQVIAFETYPKTLDRVRTAYNPALSSSSAGSMSGGALGSASANLGQMDQMPGSATQGMPDQITYAGAADTIVIINLISR